MPKVLAISSQVARGHVGLSAIVPALQALGHEVVALPTILLSNHPGHRVAAGERVAPDLLTRMLDALERNGWLAEIDAVLTGYLPSAAHVAFARTAIDRVRGMRPDTLLLCDPVLGDHPKGLYIAEDAALAIRDHLVPMAHILTPNAFELAWLAGRPVRPLREATAAVAALPPVRLLVAKSVPGEATSELVNLAATGGRVAALARVPQRASVPNGTGDLLSALVLAAHLEGLSPAAILARVTAGLDATLAASEGRDELLLAGLAARLHALRPWPVEMVASEATAGTAARTPELP
jgi:pyridoxine kinase